MMFRKSGWAQCKKIAIWCLERDKGHCKKIAMLCLKGEDGYPVRKKQCDV